MNEIFMANKILAIVGGAENVKELTYCENRIRILLNDKKKLNHIELEKLQEILAFVNPYDEIQLVVGRQGKQLFQAIIDRGGFNDTESNCDGKSMAAIKYWMQILSGVTRPVLPVLIGAGILKLLCGLILVIFPQMEGVRLIEMIDYVANGILYFFPFVFAISICQYLKSNPFYAVIIIGVLVQPFIFQSSVFTELPFGRMMYPMMGVRTAILPIFFSLWIVKQMELAVKKIERQRSCPVIATMGILFLSFFFVLVMVGPLSWLLSNAISTVLLLLAYWAPWIGTILVALFAPILLLFGVFHGEISIGTMLIEQKGTGTLIGSALLIAFFAQGVAAITVAIRTKRKEERRLSLTAGILALFGFAEPAILGVNLKYRTPFLAGIVGGAIAGTYYGIFGVARTTSEVPGILSFFFYGARGGWNTVHSIIGILIAVIITFLLTWKSSIELDSRHLDTNCSVQIQYQPKENSYEEDMLYFERLGGISILSPMEGRVIPLQHVNDPIYSNEMMGKGVAILPSKGIVVSPVDGQVIILLGAKQAIGIKGDHGEELFIHVGLDTMELEGRHFSCYVKVGDFVRVGQVLLEFELEKMKEEGYDIVTPVTICNSEEYQDVISIIHKEVKPLEVITKILSKKSR